MENHLELFEIFYAFHAKIMNQFHTSIHNLESDNASPIFILIELRLYILENYL